MADSESRPPRPISARPEAPAEDAVPPPQAVVEPEAPGNPAEEGAPAATEFPGGLTSARESMAAPEEPQEERPTRSLEIDGSEWSVTLGGRAVTGQGTDPGVVLGEFVFASSDDAGTPLRMALRPAADLMELSQEDLEAAFRMSRPFRPSMTGVVEGGSRTAAGGRHRGQRRGRSD